MDLGATGTAVAIIVAVVSGVAALVRIGMAIREAESRAKHAAIDAMSERIARVQMGAVDVEVYEAQRAELLRRLANIEHRLRLDGSGSER